MGDCCSHKESELERLARQRDQRRVLIAVLALNAVMFVLEFGAGVIANSAALMADAVDMFGDAFVYGLSLYALDRGFKWKAGAALAKGGLILLFGLGVLVEIGARITSGVPPSSLLMLAFGGLALAVNLTCLSLLWRFRAQDVNMSSTFECSRNDVVANVGVLIAAVAVGFTGSAWPDIVIAVLIAAVFLRSAVRVISQAWAELGPVTRREI
ncbi:cation transporter [Parvularcula oceani]|uniref:cation transporter n=1 Tax=Parvularcula oceani TaxID=1247963 RepID=UPI0004E1D1A1|nr:cation transporter [Parvularcula oceani]